jgi:exoribonuclease-2
LKKPANSWPAASCPKPKARPQVELDSGKRVKVKAANLLLKFEKPAPSELMAQAQTIAQTIELPLAWEFAPEDDFGFADLARDYFSDNATLAQQAGALFALHEAPHYFRRAGKGRFKKAPAEILQQALAAIEKKKLIVQQISDWAEALGRGECPQPIREQLYKILFRPDKNAPEYKAVVEASRATHLAPLDLRKGGRHRFGLPVPLEALSVRQLPQGTGFPQLTAPQRPRTAALAPVQAYSIDDSQTTGSTTLSVQGLGTGTVVLGIHIAAARAGASCRARRSTSWAAAACPPSTCRATRSPCCPTRWCRSTRWTKAVPTRQCRCTSR